MSADRLWGQLAAAVVMSMTPAMYGCTLSFAGLLLAESKSAGPAAQMSLADATFVVSSPGIGRLFGSVVSAQLSDRLGVVRAVQLSTVVSLTAWPLMTLGGRYMVIVGAILMGFVVALGGIMGRLFIAEVSSNRYRPVLCIFPGLAVGLSLLVTHTLSDYIPWRHALLVCGCTPPVVQIISTLILQQSPRWLIGRDACSDTVRKAITFYRGKNVDVSLETRNIQKSLKGLPGRNIFQQARLIVTDWDVARPCLLILVQFTFETFCGGVVLTQYAATIFQTAVSAMSTTRCSQMLAGVQMVALVAFAYALRWWGRREVLIAAAVLTGLGEFTVAAYFHFEETLSDHTWLVMIGVVGASAASMGGISQLSHLYAGEMLSISVRQSFGNVISVYIGLATVVFIYAFAQLRAVVGTGGLFAALAGVNVLQALFALCALPETRGMTLEEVQIRHFSSKRPTPPESLPTAKCDSPAAEEGVANGAAGSATAGNVQPPPIQAQGDSSIITPDGGRIHQQAEEEEVTRL